MNRHIIGISGRKRSGKDEFFKTALEVLPQGTVAKVAFADPLKSEAAEFLMECDWYSVTRRIDFLPFTDDTKNAILEQMRPLWKDESTWFGYDELVALFNSDEFKHHFRLYLQTWGTELRRQGGTDGSYLDPLSWAKLGTHVPCKAEPEYWLAAWQAVVDELPSEVTLVCAPDLRFPNEFDFLHAKNAELVRVRRPQTDDSGDPHPSESALDLETRWDTIILNIGTLEEYKAQVRDLLLAEPANEQRRAA